MSLDRRFPDHEYELDHGAAATAEAPVVDAAARRAAVQVALLDAVIGSNARLGDCTGVVAALGKAIGWQAASILELDERGGGLRCIASWQSDEAGCAPFAELTREIMFAPGLGLPGRAHATSEPVWISDLSSDPNFPRATAAGASGLRAGFAVPARSDGFTGVLEFFSGRALEEEPALVALISQVAPKVARFAEQVRDQHALRQSERLKTAMLESSLDCIVGMNHEGRVTEFNAAAEQMLGYTRSEVLGAELAELIVPATIREHHRNGLKRYLAGGKPLLLNRRIETRAQRSDGSEIPVELAVTRIAETDPPQFMAYVRDIRARKRTEEVLRFLADAGAALDASLDLDTTLQNVARMSVPFLGDGCMVDLLDEEGALHRVAAAASDQALEPVLRKLQQHRFNPEGPHPIARAARTGELQLVHSFDDALRAEIADGDEEYLATLRQWPARSAVVAPLKARGRRLGALAVASFSAKRVFGAEEIAVIEQVAGRASIAIDNARLYRQARHQAFS